MTALCAYPQPPSYHGPLLTLESKSKVSPKITSLVFVDFQRSEVRPYSYLCVHPSGHLGQCTKGFGVQFH